MSKVDDVYQNQPKAPRKDEKKEKPIKHQVKKQEDQERSSTTVRALAASNAIL